MPYELPACPATLAKRIALRAACDADASVRAAVMERAAADVEWWIDYWVDIYDPFAESGKRDIPFLLFLFQRAELAAVVAHYEAKADLLQEKSREMGMTWLNLAWVFHHWLFDVGFSALLGSLREDEVDSGTVKSLFGKLDYMLRRLPGWMKPKGIKTAGSHAHRQHLLLKHPDEARNNTIEGQPATENFSRGGRFNAIFLDEGAAWVLLEEVWNFATKDSTRFRLITSTPKGQNFFWSIRMQQQGEIDVRTILWTLHPLKTRAWYESERRKRAPENVAQELDISYQRSASGVVYPTWHDVPAGSYPYVRGWPLWLSLDFGVRDPTAIVAWQRDPDTGRTRAVDCYINQGQGIDFYVPFLTGEPPTDGTGYTHEDLAWIARRSLWGPAVIYGDPAGKQRSQTDARSVIEILETEYHVAVVTNDAARDFATRKSYTDLLLKALDVNLPACELLDRAMSNYRYPSRRQDSRSTAASDKPIHDWNSHFATAVEFFAVNAPLPRALARPKVTYRRAAWQERYADQRSRRAR